MNRELESIAQVVNNLPDEIEHLTIFEDALNGGIVFSCKNNQKESILNIVEIYKHQVEDGIIDDTMEDLRLLIYDLDFKFLENDAFQQQLDFINKVRTIKN